MLKENNYQSKILYSENILQNSWWNNFIDKQKLRELIISISDLKEIPKGGVLYWRKVIPEGNTEMEEGIESNE